MVEVSESVLTIVEVNASVIVLIWVVRRVTVEAVSVIVVDDAVVVVESSLKSHSRKNRAECCSVLYGIGGGLRDEIC